MAPFDILQSQPMFMRLVCIYQISYTGHNWIYKSVQFKRVSSLHEARFFADCGEINIYYKLACVNTVAKKFF